MNKLLDQLLDTMMTQRILEPNSELAPFLLGKRDDGQVLVAPHVDVQGLRDMADYFSTSLEEMRFEWLAYVSDSYVKVAPAEEYESYQRGDLKKDFESGEEEVAEAIVVVYSSFDEEILTSSTYHRRPDGSVSFEDPKRAENDSGVIMTILRHMLGKNTRIH